MSLDRKLGKCLLCHRQCHLSFHHLIPRKLHRRSFFHKNFSRDQLNQGVMICRQCHNGIHRTYDEMTLAKQFNTVEKLLGDEVLSTHFAWVSRQRIRV